MLHVAYWHGTVDEVVACRRAITRRVGKFTTYSYLDRDGRVVATGWFIWGGVTQVTKTT